MENKNKDIFGIKEGTHLRSPEQLNDFVRVASPGVWLVLAAIILFLAGIGVWAVFGHLDTNVKMPAAVDEGIATLYIEEYSLSSVKAGMPCYINGTPYTIGRVDTTPVQAGDILGTYWLHMFGMWEDQWVFPARIEGAPPEDGVYSAEIITESISPFLLIFN